MFHESANFAAVRRLPVIFVCENNLYSVYTHIRDRQPNRALQAVAGAHGIPATHIDGNDVEAVFAEGATAVAKARSGSGPSFLLCDTYRWREHCGPNYDNDVGYRSEAEFHDWQVRDPIQRLRDRLKPASGFNQKWERQTVEAIRSEIDAAFAAADAAPFPPVETLGAHLYA